MRRRIRATVIAGTAAAIGLLAVAACGSQPAPRAGQAAYQPVADASTSTSPATIVINQSVAEGTGETFTPTPTATPGLTAAQAWADDAEANNDASTNIPDGVTAQLGQFTLPVGPAGMPGTDDLTQANGEAYTALNELAWGFSWHQCLAGGVPSPPPGSTESPQPEPTDCTTWKFIDASTGKMIVISQQQP